MTISPDFLDSSEPQKHCYTLEQLLALCDANTKLSQEDQAWLDAATIGNELLWCSCLRGGCATAYPPYLISQENA